MASYGAKLTESVRAGAMRVRCTCAHIRGGPWQHQYINDACWLGHGHLGTFLRSATHTHGPRYAYAYVREADYATTMQLRASRVDCNATGDRRRVPIANRSLSGLLPAHPLIDLSPFINAGITHNAKQAEENFAIVEAIVVLAQCYFRNFYSIIHIWRKEGSFEWKRR